MRRVVLLLVCAVAVGAETPVRVALDPQRNVIVSSAAFEAPNLPANTSAELAVMRELVARNIELLANVTAEIRALYDVAMALQAENARRWLVRYPLVDVCNGVWSFVSGKGCHKASSAAGCATKVFTTGGWPFTQVRGRVTAFQQGSTGGWGDGGDSISIWTTTGVHVWTYALGAIGLTPQQCYCDVDCVYRCPVHGGAVPPASLGDNFYCESGNAACSADFTTFYPTRLFASRPDFQRSFPAMVADLEVRVCPSQGTNDEDIFFDTLELSVL
jgi:hypothetical protein